MWQFYLFVKFSTLYNFFNFDLPWIGVNIHCNTRIPTNSLVLTFRGCFPLLVSNQQEICKLWIFQTETDQSQIIVYVLISKAAAFFIKWFFVKRIGGLQFACLCNIQNKTLAYLSLIAIYYPDLVSLSLSI